MGVLPTGPDVEAGLVVRRGNFKRRNQKKKKKKTSFIISKMVKKGKLVHISSVATQSW